MSEEIKEWKILIGNMQNQLHEFNDKLMKLDESCDLANEISAENSNSIHNLLEHILNIDEVNKGHHEIIHEILLPKIKALEKKNKELELMIDGTTTELIDRIITIEKNQFENGGDPEIIKNHAEQIAELKSVLIKIRDILNEVFKNGD